MWSASHARVTRASIGVLRSSSVGATSPATAARWLAAALALVPADNTDRRIDLRARHALALAAAGQVQAGRDELVEVLALLPDDLVGLRRRLIVACAGLEKLLDRPDQARRRLLAANPERHAEVALELAVLGICYDRPSEVRLWAEHARALEAGTAPASPATLVSADAVAATGALLDGDDRTGGPKLGAALAGLARLDDHVLAGRLDATVNLGIAALAAERFADAAATAASGLAIARATGQGQLTVTLSTLAAVAHAERLELPAALVEIDNAAETATLQGVAFAQVLVTWARLVVHELSGDLRERTLIVDGTRGGRGADARVRGRARARRRRDVRPARASIACGSTSATGSTR